MAFNGSGVFVRLYNWVNDRNAGIKILSTRMDAEMDGMATGLSTCITKDGQTTVTANLPMAGFKHTGIGDAAARNQYAAAGQVQDSSLQYATVGGTANAITLTLTPAITAYVAGQVFYFIGTAINTGATTVNVSAVAAKNIYENGAALQGGEIQIGYCYAIFYDGTQFNLIRLGNGLITYNIQSGTTYTLTAKDCGKIVLFTSNSAVTLTFPQQSTTTLKQGFWCIIRQEGAGQVSLVLEGSDVLKSIGSATKLRATNSEAKIDLRTAGAPNTIYLFGDISA